MQYLTLILVIMIFASAASGATAEDNNAVPIGQKGVFSVASFGAKGDGVTDDTAAFQKALDEAGKTGGIVFVPPGGYLIKGHLDVPANVALQGVFQAPPCMWATFKQTDMLTYKGSVLLAVEGKGSEEGRPFIFLHHDSVLKGLAVYYPEQDRKNPVPYPWCVAGEGDNCSIVDVLR